MSSNYQPAPDLEEVGVSGYDPYGSAKQPVDCDGFYVEGGTDYGDDAQLTGMNNSANQPAASQDPCNR